MLDQSLKIEFNQRRMKRHLPIVVRQFSLKYHAVLIFLITSFLALLLSKSFYSFGLEIPWIRYPAVSLCAFVVFAFLLEFWNRLFLSRLSPQELITLQRLVQQDDFQPLASEHDEKKSKLNWDFSDLDVIQLFDDTATGLVILAFCAAFFGLIAIVAIVEVPALMGEFLLQSLFGAGMIRTVYVFDQTSWSWSLWKRIAKTFISFAFFSLLVGLLMSWYCPSATRFLDLLGTNCWTS